MPYGNMENELSESTLFLMLSAFGLLVGVIGGILAAKRTRGILTAVLLSILVAITAPMALWFIWTVIKAVQQSGYTLGDSLSAGLGAMVLLAVSVPFATGPPAAIAAAISYFVTRRSRQDQSPTKDADPDS